MQHDRDKVGERRNYTYLCEPKRAIIPPIPAERQAKSDVAIWYFCILEQTWLLWHLNDIVTASGGNLAVEQKAKLDEAMALVGRTQLPLCCNVCLQCHCCTIELDIFVCLMPLQSQAD